MPIIRNRPARQFIAGVRCGRCGALDSTVLVFDGVERIECTKCAHSEKRPTPSDVALQDMRTVRFVDKNSP